MPNQPPTEHSTTGSPPGVDVFAVPQDTLTDHLSGQARRAVEMLVDAVGRADKDSGGAALAGVAAGELYEGAVTVVMRLVFMLAAEERRLLPGDDAFYAANYAISGLADRLIGQANLYGEDALARQAEGFPQVLAAARVVHDGVRHQTLNIKGYGGSVFDPHRFPWLEGTQPGGTGRAAHVDDRTMLHILTGLTRWQGRRLAYRTLDVEQIGYVYEGLLDHTAVQADVPYLGLRGSKEPEVPLAEIEAQAARGDAALAKWAKDVAGLTLAQVKKALDVGVPDPEQARLLAAACGGNQTLADRVAPFLGLLRADERTGQPAVFLPGEWFVTASSARSDAGSYYTPRSLAEEVVKHALDGLVYHPGPLQTLDEDDWRIVTPDTILDLSVADIAMGSGAFLVAADRYLADRLIEAVTTHANNAPFTDPALQELAAAIRDAADTDPDQRDSDADEATLLARRLIASRCLYGADINPMAVEMAKLSLWLATAAKDQPFGFLDHHLTVGDSLLGLTDVLLLESAGSTPPVGCPDFVLLSEAAAAAAFTATPPCSASWDIHLNTVKGYSETLASPTTPEPEKEQIRALLHTAAAALHNTPPGQSTRRIPVHWAARFPEVFPTASGGGFDAVIGNPPYLGGQKIGSALGPDYRNYLVHTIARNRKGSADLAVYFLLAAAHLTRTRIGIIATNSIAQGDSREVGLDHITSHDWTVVRATRSAKWPSKSANLEYAAIYLHRGTHPTTPRILDGTPVPSIAANLRPGAGSTGKPHRLHSNRNTAYIGSYILGAGFTLTETEAREMIDADPRNTDVIFPYLNGKDLNTSPTFTPSRWVINFHDWTEDEARRYPLPFARVETLVKPERMQLNTRHPTGRRRQQYWWQYGGSATALYQSITGLEHVIALTQVSNTLQPARITSRQVFGMIVVFPSDSPALLGILASAVHGEWVRIHASSMRTDIRYTPSDVCATYPFPDDAETLTATGSAMETARLAVMRHRTIGLTATYNLVNNPDEHGEDVAALREAHAALDRAVLNTYGWTDLDPQHGFFDTEQGVRFTMAPEVTVDVCTRLLDLNRQRHNAETQRREPRRARRSTHPAAHPTLFD